MRYLRSVFHLAVALFVAPTPGLLLLFYLSGGGSIPPVPGLVVMGISAVGYGLWLRQSRRERDLRRDRQTRATRHWRVPTAPDDGMEARLDGSSAEAVGRRSAPMVLEATDRISDGHKRQILAVRSFQDLPDPLSDAHGGHSALSMLSRRVDDLRQLKRLTTDHKASLLNQWHRTVRKDRFGVRDISDWALQADRFLISSGYAPGTLNRHEAIASLTADIEHLAEGGYGAETARHAGDGGQEPAPSRSLAFHQRCAITLQRNGWATHVAAEPRSDGIDVFAENEDWVVGLHCRIYTHPVSDDVVAQLIRAASYYCLDAAAIVAPSGFTRDARAAAREGNVALLDRDDLPQLLTYVREPLKVVKLTGHDRAAG